MSDVLPFVFGVILTLVLIGVVTTVAKIYQNTHQIKLLVERVEQIRENLMLSDIVSLQVRMTDTGGPVTLRNMRSIAPLSKAMLEEMSISELKLMAFTLEPELNGDVVWEKGKIEAVTSLLTVMNHKKRLTDVINYIRENREDIEI